MKRRQKNINQPTIKKPDINVSVDFRSKIGAKLQTLLNGFTPDRSLTAKNRRQLYEDLFGKPRHSEIIIDPTIVIKSEPEEESSNDTSSFNSQNFLVSAKTRITELLNKKQDEANKHTFKDNEKENNLSSKDKSSASSSKNFGTQTRAQSLLSNSFKKKRKVSCSRDNSSEPSTSKVRLKNVDDALNPKDGTKLNQFVPTITLDNNSHSSSLKSNSILKDNEQSVDLVAEVSATNEVSDMLVVSPDIHSLIAAGPINNEVDSDLPFVIDECNSSKNNPKQSTSKSTEFAATSGYVPSKNSNLIPDVIPIKNLHFKKSINNFPSNNADDSELVDNPDVHESILGLRAESMRENKQEAHSREPEVVLLCVKTPTHEVITLEDDNDDSEDIIEEVHECVQCGKAFRAKSLLNFHIRMHGKSDSSSLPSSSQSCCV